MESCLDDLVYGEENVCPIYLDGVIIASRSFEDHISYFQKVFAKFQKAELKLSPQM